MVLVLGYLNIRTFSNSGFKTRLDTITARLLYAHSEQWDRVAGLTRGQRKKARVCLQHTAIISLVIAKVADSATTVTHLQEILYMN